MNKKILIACVALLLTHSLAQAFEWNSANLYLVLPDRFHNADPSNDFGRNLQGHPAWRFSGGDLRGITKKLDDGYFTDLGVNVLWITPVQKQVLGSDSRKSYAYHGYWIQDWTEIDPSFGTKQDLKELVESAHKRGIRVLLDAVINHCGPATDQDPSLTDPQWVRLCPPCDYTSYKNYVECTVAGILPDILTEKNEDVELPTYWTEKWKNEGRYDEELAELHEFFSKTQLPRTPRAYIMKWLTDLIREYGIDGFRVDTVKHVEPDIWPTFKTLCQQALEEYRQKNPDKPHFNNTPFFLLGEVYGFYPSPTANSPQENQTYRFSDKKINYFDYGFDALINFSFASEAHNSYATLFQICNQWIQKDFAGKTLVNYLRSHDDPRPFDPRNANPYETATKLLLAPGLSQIYYGQEIARPLQHNLYPGQEFNDANLRSTMNWEDLSRQETRALLTHYGKLGQFRIANPAVGAGRQTVLQENPLVLERAYTGPSEKNASGQNTVIIALDLPPGPKKIPVGNQFATQTTLHDSYSGLQTKIEEDQNLQKFVEIDSPYNIVLLAPPKN
jgi:alpha-amylase